MSISEQGGNAMSTGQHERASVAADARGGDDGWAEFARAAAAVRAVGFRHNSIGVAEQLAERADLLVHLAQIRQAQVRQAQVRQAQVERVRAGRAQVGRALARRTDAQTPVDSSREHWQLTVLERAALSGHGAMRLVRWPSRLGARVDLAGGLTDVELAELDDDRRESISRDESVWELVINGLWSSTTYGYSA